MEHHLESEAAQATLSLHLSKCHIVGNHMSRFFYDKKWKYGKCPKILNIFLLLFSNKMLVFRAGIHKNASQNSKQGRTWSDEAVWSESTLFV